MKDLKNFISTHADDIDNNNWEKIYQDTQNLTSFQVGELTSIFYKADINPLLYLNTVPMYYLYHSSIDSLVIPDSVTSIGDYAFFDCNNLTSIEIPNSVTSIGSSAFGDCNSLTNIKIPNSVTSIGDNTFSGCSSLISITISNKITNIGIRMFSSCTNLTNITIPDNVTNIRDYAFFYCTNLTNIKIPNRVTSIGNYVFYKCIKLSEIFFDGTKNQWENIKKNEYWNRGSSLKKITCIDGEVNLS